MKIFLIGYRCTGKSTTGKILADLLYCPFYDTDLLIEKRAGKSIADMVDSSGWEAFRQLEKETLLLTASMETAVISTGGGIILDPVNRGFLSENGACIWLWADAPTVMGRLQKDSRSASMRPALTDQDIESETQKMLKIRNPYYEQLSQLKIDTIVNSPEKAADLIKRRVWDVR